MPEPLDLAAIRARHAEFVRRHEHTALRCCTAHDSADDVPALLDYVAKLHASINRRCDEDLATFNRQRALTERIAAERDEIRATREDVSGRLIAALAELDATRADYDRLAAEHRALADRLREVTAERDLWVGRFYESVPQRFVLGADCPVDGCDGERVELHALGVADPVGAVLDCGHEPAPGSATYEPSAEADPQPES